MKTVFIEENEIRLNSQLDELAFGKMNYSSIITEKGLLFKAKEITERNYSFTHEEWGFDEVKTFSEADTPMVYYCGSTAGFSKDSKTLLEYFELAGSESSTKKDKDSMYDAAFLTCSVLTYAAKEKINIPVNGAGGILIDFTDEIKILFLPQNLFRYSSNGLSPVDYSNLHGCWINQTLIDLPAICFERAVIAYKMLSGRFPFPSSVEVERNADILDRKFLPIELCINGISKELALEINKALQLNVNVVNIPGKKQKGKANEDLTPTADFPLDILKNANTMLSESTLSDEEFNLKAQEYEKSQTSKVETKRKIRRNKTKIITALIFVLILGIFIRNTIKTRGEEYTSKGLTSTQVIQAFVYATNTKDTSLAGNITKGKTAQRYADVISQMYVVSKQRQSYNADNGFVSPQRWFFYVKDSESDGRTGVYGITNLTINGIPQETELELYKKNQNPAPVTEENGIQLKNGDKVTHQVEYYQVVTEETDTDSNGIKAAKETCKYTLTYSGKKWVISDIDMDTEEFYFDSYEFKKSYYNLLKDSDNDVIESANRLKFQYDWIPTEYELKEELNLIKLERTEMEQEFNVLFGNPVEIPQNK